MDQEDIITFTNLYEASDYHETNDYKGLSKLINAYVRVDLIKDLYYIGFVHSVDPVSRSMILIAPKADKFQTVLISGHSIANITLEDKPANIQRPVLKHNEELSSEDLLKRRKQLVAWFKLNMLPVTVVNDNIKIGNVTVLPPYKSSDISTDTAVVAMQIRNVIDKMPADYEYFEPK